MPATAGRVRMPANNRVHSSAALQTHGIWQSAIGYDPYAPNKAEKKDKSAQKSSVPEPEQENAYDSFQGLLQLARMTSSNADEARGSCKKCGRVGHLTFQCRNFLSAKDSADMEGKDADAFQVAVLSGLERLKGERVKLKGKTAVESDESTDDEEEESDSSDSDYDSEIERAIAEKYGKKLSNGKSRGGKSKKKDSDDSDDDGSDGYSRDRRKRGRSKKRSAKRRHSDSEDEDEGRRKKRKEKRRRRRYDDSSDEEEDLKHKRKSRKEKRRKSHRHSRDDSSDDSIEQRHKRRSKRAPSASDSDMNSSDDSRMGRDKKRSEKKGRKHRHAED